MERAPRVHLSTHIERVSFGAASRTSFPALSRPSPISIYHITHIDNLPLIFGHGALLSTNAKRRLNISHTSIARPGIQARRSLTQVPCGPRGVLHDYVPFYFCCRSPMLASISYNQGNVTPELEADVVHLRATVEAVVGAGLRFVFSDGMPTMVLSSMFDDLTALDKVRWDIVSSSDWANSERRRLKEAEFLVWQAVPWSLVQEIGVRSEAKKAQVEALPWADAHRPPVNVRRSWYIR